MTRIFLVGGAVRDKLMDEPCKDRDFAVEAESFDAMKEFVRSMGGQIFMEKPEFLTIRAKMPDITSGADFVLCRKDGGYTDGRRPDAVEAGTIRDDLERRDFTINAMAIDMATQELIDPFGGQMDIRKRVIRCVGAPTRRFKEDRLRLLRAFRFSITRNMEIAPSIIECLNDPSIVRSLEGVSMDRIREELAKCFHYNTQATLSFLHAFPLMSDACFGHGALWLKPTTEG